jgi:hypothetical protein
MGCAVMLKQVNLDRSGRESPSLLPDPDPDICLDLLWGVAMLFDLPFSPA